jgi:hypothetical protein
VADTLVLDTSAYFAFLEDEAGAERRRMSAWHKPANRDQPPGFSNAANPACSKQQSFAGPSMRPTPARAPGRLRSGAPGRKRCRRRRPSCFRGLAAYVEPMVKGVIPRPMCPALGCPCNRPQERVARDAQVAWHHIHFGALRQLHACRQDSDAVLHRSGITHGPNILSAVQARKHGQPDELAGRATARLRQNLPAP